MKSSSNVPVWTWLGLVVAVAASLVSIAARHAVEARNRAVAPALEMAVIQDAAARSGVPLPDALEELKRSGLRSVVLPEETVGDWINRGRAQWSDLAGNRLLVLDRTLLESWNTAATRQRLEFNVQSADPESETVTIALGPTLPGDTLRTLPMGIDAELARQVTAADLYLVVRHTPIPNASREQIESTLRRSRELGAQAYLPQGDAVLGHRTRIKETVEILRNLGMVYASPEFARMAGEAAMTAAAADHTVRLHAIQAAEVDRLSPGEIVERFARAYAERNQRILLLRPFDAGGETPLQNLALSLQKISRAVIKEGGGLASPRPWQAPQVPSWVSPAIALGLGITFFGLLLSRWPRAGHEPSALPRWAIALGALATLGVVALAVVRDNPSYLATCAALATPLLAYLAWDGLRRLPVLVQFAVLSLITLTGGLCVAGLLNGPAYFVRAETFFAVKVAHFLPLVVIGVAVVWANLELGKAWRSPLTWGGLISLGLVLFAAIFMLARTGNDNPAAVSGIELQIRSLLENFFTTRPRTKEFLIGHPAMVIALFLGAAAQRASENRASRLRMISGGLFVIGMIGQTSMINTLCHLHTPIIVGVIRTAIGWGVGLAIGLAIWAVLSRTFKQEAAA